MRELSIHKGDSLILTFTLDELGIDYTVTTMPSDMVWVAGIKLTESGYNNISGIEYKNRIITVNLKTALTVANIGDFLVGVRATSISENFAKSYICNLTIEDSFLISGSAVPVDNQYIDMETFASDMATAIENSNNAADRVDESISLANDAASNADAKANLAYIAATNADSKSVLANIAATNANNASDLANTATAIANTAATNANAKADIADIAAAKANAATSNLFTIDSVYPVGSIYMNVSSASPETLFGGTWAQLPNSFLIGASDAYPSGSTGGETDVTLSSSQIPSHSHSFSGTTNSEGSHTHNIYSDLDAYYTTSGTRSWSIHNSTSSGGSSMGRTTSAGSHSHSVSGTTGNKGSDGSHNNMPPYLSVYMWQRTA